MRRPTRPSTYRRLLPRRLGRGTCSRGGTKAACTGYGAEFNCGAGYFTTCVCRGRAMERVARPALGYRLMFPSGPAATNSGHRRCHRLAANAADSRRSRCERGARRVGARILFCHTMNHADLRLPWFIIAHAALAALTALAPLLKLTPARWSASRQFAFRAADCHRSHQRVEGIAGNRRWPRSR
jgi:hypothetical protein